MSVFPSPLPNYYVSAHVPVPCFYFAPPRVHIPCCVFRTEMSPHETKDAPFISTLSAPCSHAAVPRRIPIFAFFRNSHTRSFRSFILMRALHMIIFALWAAATGAALSPAAAISADGLTTKTPAKVRHR